MSAQGQAVVRDTSPPGVDGSEHLLVPQRVGLYRSPPRRYDTAEGDGGMGSNVTTKRKSSTKNIPEEPDELRVWREIARQRDSLVQQATAKYERRSYHFHGGTDEGSNETEIMARSAREDLQALDKAIRKRPQKSVIPHKLAGADQNRRLYHAQKSVHRYLTAKKKKASNERELGWFAFMSLFVVAADKNSSINLRKLEKTARKRQLEKGHSRALAEVARLIVAEVAGVTPDIRAMRR